MAPSNTVPILFDAGSPLGHLPNPPSVCLWSWPSLCPPPTLTWSQTSFLVLRAVKAKAHTYPPFPARGSSIPHSSLCHLRGHRTHTHTNSPLHLPKPPASNATLPVTHLSSPRCPAPHPALRGNQDRGARVSVQILAPTSEQLCSPPSATQPLNTSVSTSVKWECRQSPLPRCVKVAHGKCLKPRPCSGTVTSLPQPSVTRNRRTSKEPDGEISPPGHNFLSHSLHLCRDPPRRLLTSPCSPAPFHLTEEPSLIFTFNSAFHSPGRKGLLLEMDRR